MKIGFISDIHADLKSLHRALDILQGQQVETVVCCGDLVGKGRDGDAVIQLIQKRNIPSVAGNHDGQALIDQPWFRENLGSIYKMLLTEESLTYLDSLPTTLDFLCEGKRILVAHGAPWSYDEYIYPYSPPDMFKRVVEAGDYHAIVLGHTHEPMIVQVSDKWIFNPGSVSGRQVYGSSTCAVLSLPDLNFHVFDLQTANKKHPPYINISKKIS